MQRLPGTSLHDRCSTVQIGGYTLMAIDNSFLTSNAPRALLSLTAAILILLPGTGVAELAETEWNPAAVRSYLDKVAESVEGGRVGPQWLDGSRFWYRSSLDGQDGQAWLVDPAHGGKEPAPDGDRFAAALAEQLSIEPDAVDLLAAGSDSTILFDADEVCHELALADYSIRSAPEARCNEFRAPAQVRDMFPIQGWGRREIPSPDHAWLATLIDDDFAVRAQDATESVYRTDGGSPVDRWFFAGDLWEASTTPWSPDSRYVVFRRHDMSEVPGMEIVDYFGERESVSSYRYWSRVGEPLPVTTFRVLDITTGDVADVDVGGDADTFAFFLGWSNDGSRFYVVRFSRDLKRLELHAASPAQGEARRLLTETRERGWVKWPGGAATLTPLPSGSGFIWRSDEGGWFQLYLHDESGRRIRKLTDDRFPVFDVIGIDESGAWVYYHAASDPARPYDRHINRVRIDGGARQQLTTLPGIHSGEMSPDFRYIVDNHSSLDRPPRSDLLAADGRLQLTLEAARVDRDFRETWSDPEAFKVRLPGTVIDVHGVLFKPPGFDPDRRYPVIERIYGGMQSTVIGRRYFGIGLGRPGGEYHSMIAYLTRLGFVVVAMDTPGTPGRGREFNLAVHGNWPLGIIDDHAAALNALVKERPYLDGERIGIEGNSFGGHMALRALIDAPGFYRAASASVPETDMIDGAHWMEFQLGMLEDNRAHYETESIVARAGEIEGELLLVAGTSDVNVPVSNTFKLLDALAESDKHYELVLFPGANHAHQGRGDRYAYAVNRIGLFFLQHLCPLGCSQTDETQSAAGHSPGHSP